MMFWTFVAVLSAFVLPFSIVSGVHAYWDQRLRPLVFTKTYKKIAPLVCFNVVCVQGIMVGVLLQIKQLGSHNSELRASDVIGTLVFSTVAFEVLFYLVHCLFHQPWFFARIHCVHHELKDTVAFGAPYCHPVEHAVGNILPASAGLLILPSPHIFTVCLWTALAAIITACMHGGYGWEHQIHHATHGRPFALLGIMDKLEEKFKSEAVRKTGQ